MERKVDALVLRTADFGENDKMLTLFTLQSGKLSAAAKGVRKAGAKLRFAAQPFCFAEYVLAQKGERFTVISAAQTDGFYPLREDIGKFYAAACVVGLCDALLYENIVNEELFLRAVEALRAMCEEEALPVLLSFFMKALELSGYMLDLSACAGCGAVLRGTTFFDVNDGCFYCADCGRGAGVRAGTLAALRRCAGEPAAEESAAQEERQAGERRALKLLYAYFCAKTESRVRAVEEFLRLEEPPCRP